MNTSANSEAATPEAAVLPEGRRLRSGTALVALGAVANQGSTLLVNIAAAQTLPAASFGAYATTLTTVQTAATTLALGLGYMAARYVPELRMQQPEAAGRVIGGTFLTCLALGGVGSIGVGMGADWIAIGVLGKPGVAEPLRLAAPVVLGTILTSFLSAVCVGLGAFTLVARTGVIAGLLYTLLGVAGLRLGGLPGVSTALALSAGVTVALYGYATQRAMHRAGVRPGWRLERQDRLRWSRFGLPGALSGFTTMPALWSAQAALARTPDGLVEVGVYLACMNVLTAVLFLPYMASTVATALINERSGVRDTAGMRTVFRDNLRLTFIVVLGAAGALGAAAPLVLRVFGPRFASGSAALAVLLAASVPEALTIALNQVLQLRERMWDALLYVNIPRDTTLAILPWFVVPRYGLLGLVGSYLVARLIALATIWLLTRRGAAELTARA